MAKTPEEDRAARLILASGSLVRARLLRDAGLDFDIVPPDLDESLVKDRARNGGQDAAACALALARAKAEAIATRYPGALVLGADQMLVVGARWFDKPRDLAEARSHLRELRGRTHVLQTAACVVRDGRVLWHHVSRPELAMRSFSDTFLDDYIAAEGESLLGSVGCYRFEERGVQLFEAVKGEYFAILGMPLIALLAFLRDAGILKQ